MTFIDFVYLNENLFLQLHFDESKKHELNKIHRLQKDFTLKQCEVM